MFDDEDYGIMMNPSWDRVPMVLSENTVDEYSSTLLYTEASLLGISPGGVYPRILEYKNVSFYFDYFDEARFIRVLND
jgi:hypothetical protein